MAIDPARALSFGRFAEEYERWRPGYPPEAVDWLVPPGATRVAELGAGTGKLTGSLLGRGLVVDAIEPDPQMLAVLRSSHPGAVPHRASADALPLPEHSVDAVLVADAWHWFAHAAAIDEVRRVLRPGGWLGLVWNTPAPVEPWEFELVGIDPDHHGGSELTAPGLPSAPEGTAYFPGPGRSLPTSGAPTWPPTLVSRPWNPPSGSNASIASTRSWLRCARRRVDPLLR
jgi:SAM-dependent methyltransferase